MVSAPDRLAGDFLCPLPAVDRADDKETRRLFGVRPARRFFGSGQLADVAPPALPEESVPPVGVVVPVLAAGSVVVSKAVAPVASVLAVEPVTSPEAAESVAPAACACACAASSASVTWLGSSPWASSWLRRAASMSSWLAPGCSASQFLLHVDSAVVCACCEPLRIAWATSAASDLVVAALLWLLLAPPVDLALWSAEALPPPPEVL